MSQPEKRPTTERLVLAPGLTDPEPVEQLLQKTFFIQQDNHKRHMGVLFSGEPPSGFLAVLADGAVDGENAKH